ncbi:MAG TPA: bifunctional serine/threonine-protein kinase/formylglycine-generating enzyme family protein [Gemmataceae bacterium]|nr:bifunctional serine/threonine-protein kinase/formylglycine-generating enzyme family protein [Gemmataceae bacterium]
MMPDDAMPDPDEEQFHRILSEYEDALAAGKSPDRLHGPEVPARLAARVARARACMERLHRAGPRRQTVGDQTPRPAQLLPRGQTASPLRLGRFEILRELGRGGFGIVYLAYDGMLRREVALKVPRPEVLEDAELRGRFVREARLAAALDHPNLVPVLDVHDDGLVCFIITAYCRGRSLHAWLSERTEPVPARTAATLAAALAAAVDHVHRRGILHRDIKPGNVLLEPTEPDIPGRDGLGFTPRLTDFGLAKSQAGSTTHHTRTGALLGTPAYMAPEQADPRFAEVSPATDVYALGVLLYEVLTGQMPFQGSTQLDTLRQILDDEPIALRRLRRGVPRDLETICHKCLTKNPAKRYRTAKALGQDLGRFLEGRPIEAKPAGLWERGKRWAWRNPAAAVLLLLVSLSPSLAVLALYALDQSTRDTRADAQFASLFAVDKNQLGAAIRLAQDYLPRKRDHYLQTLHSHSDDPERKLRAALVLAATDEGAAVYLTNRILDVEPTAVGLSCDALKGRKSIILPQWEEDLRNDSRSSGQRLRAACAIAQLAPEDAIWQNLSAQIVEMLLAERSIHLLAWADLLAPVKRSLMPHLRSVYDNTASTAMQRTAAAGILAEYAASDVPSLVDLLSRAGVEQFPAFMEKLSARPAEAIPILGHRLTDLDSGRPEPRELEELARRKAFMAIALFRLGQPEAVLQNLQAKPDPRQRYQIIHSLGRLGADAAQLSQLIRSTDEPAILAGLLLALGDFESGRIPQLVRQDLALLLGQLYSEHPDSGVHSAVDWLWRRLEYPLPLRSPHQTLEEARARDSHWGMTRQGFTFCLISNSAEFMMGSPTTELGRPSDERIGSEGNESLVRMPVEPFAIATTEVTLKQFREFDPDHVQTISQDGAVPVTSVDLLAVAKYCNWLSDRDGLPESEFCFNIVPKGKTFEVVLPCNYLERIGYRIPTEAEWEFACRAGTTTSRFFGESDEFLRNYAHFLPHSEGRTWPVGSLRPNPLGLFDIFGNVSEWTLRSPQTTDKNPPQIIKGEHYRSAAWSLRAARRVNASPANSTPWVGFRLAKTLKKA